MKIYTHARNIRFLPQLESLEPARRVERTNELSQAMGMPAKVVEAYLSARRQEDADNALPDGGDELLYEAEALDTLAAVARRLGNTESERLEKLLALSRRAAAAAAVSQEFKEPSADE